MTLRKQYFLDTTGRCLQELTVTTCIRPVQAQQTKSQHKNEGWPHIPPQQMSY